jgi:oxygen-independent coproporphyrinogen III oxidase
LPGIYIHIPFCRKKCNYCNFHFSTSLYYKDDLINALLKEISLQKDYLAGELVETIYIGGGTPSLLPTEDLEKIMFEIRKYLPVSADAEITLEANPDDITEEKLEGWKKIGINRLSIGIQSFFEEDLVWMNRAHTAKQANESIRLALQYFTNITIDFIYGTPELTNEKWKQNIATAIALKIPHLSCYALTVEPKTPLEKLIRLKKKEGINPDKQSEQFLLLMQWMAEAGYEHYEISNFALPGYRSRHNSSYWQGKKYLGLGPSAHSFNGNTRQWNVSNNSQYIESLKNGIILFEKEELTATQQLNEYIMTAMRTAEGISLSKFKKEEADTLLKKCNRYLESNLMKLENNYLILTKEGKLLADGIAADLFF